MVRKNRLPCAELPDGPALGAAWLGVHVFLNKDDFRITVRDGTVHFRGRFPPAHRTEMTRFLLQEIAPPGMIRVIGNWKPGRVLRVTVQGTLPAGSDQRIRNFVKMSLKG